MLLEYHAPFSELHVPDAAHRDDDVPPRQATAPDEQLVGPMPVRIEADVGDDSDAPLAAEDREAAALREPVFELAAKWVGERKRRHAHQPPATSLGTVGAMSASRTSAIAMSLLCLRRRRDRPSISTLTSRFSQIAMVEGAVGFRSRVVLFV